MANYQHLGANSLGENSSGENSPGINEKIDEILSLVQHAVRLLADFRASSSDSGSEYVYGKGYSEILDDGAYYTPYSESVNLHSAAYISEAAMAKYMIRLASERNYGS